MAELTNASITWNWNFWIMDEEYSTSDGASLYPNYGNEGVQCVVMPVITLKTGLETLGKDENEVWQLIATD